MPLGADGAEASFVGLVLLTVGTHTRSRDGQLRGGNHLFQDVLSRALIRNFQRPPRAGIKKCDLQRMGSFRQKARTGYFRAGIIVNKVVGYDLLTIDREAAAIVRAEIKGVGAPHVNLQIRGEVPANVTVCRVALLPCHRRPLKNVIRSHLWHRQSRRNVSLGPIHMSTHVVQSRRTLSIDKTLCHIRPLCCQLRAGIEGQLKGEIRLGAVLHRFQRVADVHQAHGLFPNPNIVETTSEKFIGDGPVGAATQRHHRTAGVCDQGASRGSDGFDDLAIAIERDGIGNAVIDRRPMMPTGVGTSRRCLDRD